MIVREVLAQETYSVRKEVLRNNLPLPEAMEGDFEKFTFHLGMFLNTELIGVATFMKNKNSSFNGVQYQLRGMATCQNYQHRGVGRKLLFKGIAILKKRNVEVLWCNARVTALSFYDKLGFISVGEEFEIHLVGPHFVMFKKLM
jgi:predicted GNAT family N-acyltransferase|tara:strand:+ start:1279 stop:1710 length:432 start_codon:yes stop_codon:yes gene_type:complete